MSEPVRVIMWSVPRSRSSIVAKCMDGVPDSQIFFQVYSSAFWTGLGEFNSSDSSLQSEGFYRVQDEITNAGAQSKSFSKGEAKADYQWVKRQLEANYPGKRFLFAKEMAYCINGKFEYLPKGYRHIFLIREPVKVFQSLKKTVPEIVAVQGQQIPGMEGGDFELDKQPPHLIAPEYGFKELVNLYEYLQEANMEPDPIVVDSDDLVNDPARILSAVLERLGVQFQDSILNWEKGMDVMEEWVVSRGVKNRITKASSFKSFRDSTGFLQETAVPGTTHSTSANLTADVQHCVEFSMPYFMKLYEKRLKV
ncbi:uncharacterized protein LOC119734360 [Patiria miniata]|uniref:Sulfotransferase family protein n=1 Tax=Patiria miniata TaxID=46514 RepID=A0A914AJH5_PATMI|nr:uncharacterized protein LOC119734360 [Patiria miniata]